MSTSESLSSARSARSRVHEHLRTRRAELAEAIQNRVFSLEDPAEIGDPVYTAGLREAVTVAIDYALEAVFDAGGRETPIPPTLFVQARQAARNGVSLDTVLRRYFAGYSLLADYILQESEQGLSAKETQRICRAQATLFDRVLGAITDEYKRHADLRATSLEQARATRVRALLAGELVDSSELGYEIEGRWHLGAIARSTGSRAALRELAARLDARLLAVDDGDCTWAWFGSERKADPKAAAGAIGENWSPDVPLALGEPGEGIAGWRLTHRQAKAATAIALQGPRVVSYGEVALLASALADEVLAASLRETYLRPLEEDRDGGSALRETLRAYFATERNISSTAAVLGVNRKTVMARLASLAERLGCEIAKCATELDIALQLEELEWDGQDRLSPAGRLSLHTLTARTIPHP